MMLGLAVGIDYALFIVSGHRAELAEGQEATQARAENGDVGECLRRAAPGHEGQRPPQHACGPERAGATRCVLGQAVAAPCPTARRRTHEPAWTSRKLRPRRGVVSV